MSVESGGPAFPVSHYVNSNGETFESKPTGMSLREWYAGQALIGILSDPTTCRPADAYVSIAVYCFAIADEMLKARGQEQSCPSRS